MAKIIEEQVIEDEFDEFAVRYPDGSVIILDDEEDADQAIHCALLVVPDAGYVKVQRHVYITEWVEAE